MAQDWRILESRDQALLHVVLRAARDLAPGCELPAGPVPLHPCEASILDDFAARLKKEAGHTETCAQILSEFTELYSAETERARLISASAPWKASQVVSLWIAAARALVVWQRAITSPPRKAVEPVQPDRSPATGVINRVARLFGARNAGVSAVEPLREVAAATVSPVAVPPKERDEVRALLESLEKAYRRDAVAFMSPVMWCATHADLFQLEAGDVEPPGGLHDGDGNDREACLIALLEWCGDLSRFPKNHQWPPYSRYSRDFAKAATTLFGVECISSDKPVAWRNGNGVLERPAAEQIVLLYRAPVVTKAQRIIATGWATTPVPLRLASTVLQATGETPAFHSLRRAAEKAAAAWRSGGRSSLADGFPCRCEEWTAAFVDGSADSSVLALVRLVALLYMLPPPSASIPEPHLRFMLKLDGGFRLTVNRGTAQASDTCVSRRIPYGSDTTSDKECQAGSVCFKREDGHDLSVGIFGPPVCGAPIGVLDAIEDLDWHLWMLDAARRNALVDPGSAGLISRMLDRGQYASWENVKAQWMRAPASPDVLRTVMGHLYDVRLGLLRSSSEKLLQAVGHRLRDDVSRCERAIVEYLNADHPDAFAGLFPPRFPDASCDVARWGDADLWGDTRWSRFRIEWKLCDEPFGVHLCDQDSTDGSDCVLVAVSAGRTATEDLRVLNAPCFTICPEKPSGTWFVPLHDFARSVWRASRGKERADVAEALQALRTHYLSAEGADAFNELVQQAIEGDHRAMEWLSLLRQDDRFRFECYPGINCDGKAVAVSPPAPTDSLEWQDHDLPRGGNAKLFFSMVPERARRVLSRGRPVAESADQAAESLEAAGRECPEKFRAAVVQLREATDRWNTFPNETAHPMASAAAKAFLEDVPLAAWEGREEIQARFVDAFALWCRALGHRLIPPAWHPLTGTVAAGCVSCDAVRFHPIVPAGNVVVETFGLDGPHAAAWRGYQSAGPAPEGYAVLVEAAQGLTADVPLVREVKTCLADLPRHYLAGKAPLAAPGLFQAVWNLVLGAPEAAHIPAAVWTSSVAELLRNSCGMVLFEPTGVGEYPSGWLRAPDGKSPRGDWIARVIRPGVRTAKNTLVWPAIVETE